MSCFSQGGGLYPAEKVLMFAHVGSISLRRSTIERIFGLGTLQLAHRDDCAPGPDRKPGKVSPLAMTVSGLLQPDAVAHDLWEHICAHNKAADLPLPKLTV